MVSTPIGTASDITLRALDLLKNGNVLVAEDTRVLKKLLKLHHIGLNGREVFSYHDYNAEDRRKKLVNLVKENKSVVLVSDAGTPLIADPGYKLVQEMIKNNLSINSVPGPSAILAALTVAGLPTNSFYFGGFVPSKLKAKETFFSNLIKLPSTLVFYESSKRLVETLIVLRKTVQINREIVVCRELTKKFEEVKRGSIDLVTEYFYKKERIKGEIVLLVAPPDKIVVSEDEIDKVFLRTSETVSFKDAVRIVAEKLNVSRKLVYDRALKLKPGS